MSTQAERRRPVPPRRCRALSAGQRRLGSAACGDDASALSGLTEALTLACRHGYVRALADEGAPIRALLASCLLPGRGSGTRPGRIGPGYLAALVRACGPADAAPPRSRASDAAPGLAADRPRAGGAAAARRRPVKPAHHPRPGGGARHGQEHVTYVRGKLGADNRTGAVARARQLGVIP